MLNFRYDVPTKIFFGRGAIKHLAPQLKEYAGRVLLLYGGGSVKRQGLYDQVVAVLREAKIPYEELGGVQPNPRIATVRAGVALCREKKLDFILAVGGGSVIDCGKAIAAGFHYGGDPWDFFVGQAEVKDALPLASILTLAATGSEMNGGTVVTNEETRQKLAMGGEALKPRFSILDPVYTFTVPAMDTAAGVADIMSHVFEQYFSPTPHTYVQDRLAEALLLACIAAGPRALAAPDDYDARAELMWAGSLALNDLLSCGKRGDWATHIIQHELSALYDISHGVGLAVLTPHWMRYVLDEATRPKFVAYGRNVWRVAGGDDAEAAAEGIARTAAFFRGLGLPATLRDAGIDDRRLAEMARGAVRFGPVGTFKKLEEKDVLAILKAAL